MHLVDHPVVINSQPQPQPDNSHHDTHATPPQFVQDAYWRYISGKKVDLDNDPAVIDFHRGLSQEQQASMRPVGVVPAAGVEQACTRFRDSILGPHRKPQFPDFTFKDVPIYEHRDFPGLQVTPGILPPETQVLFLGQILHDCLANPKHKTNLQSDYDLTYPKPALRSTMSSKKRAETEDRPSSISASLFDYEPTHTHSSPKDSSKHPSLNMAQFISTKLRWLTIGEQYDWPTRSYSGKDETPFPEHVKALVAGLFPHLRAESGVCLIYSGRGFMPVHRDVSEQCERALASFSFGCDGIFLVARGEEEPKDAEEASKRIVAIRVHSGDCVHMDGETRWAWHAMPRTITSTCPDYLSQWPFGTPGASEQENKMYEKWKGFMASKRLNVSCRQVWD